MKKSILIITLILLLLLMTSCFPSWNLSPQEGKYRYKDWYPIGYLFGDPTQEITNVVLSFKYITEEEYKKRNSINVFYGPGEEQKYEMLFEMEINNEGFVQYEVKYTERCPINTYAYEFEYTLGEKVITVIMQFMLSYEGHENTNKDGLPCCLILGSLDFYYNEEGERQNSDPEDKYGFTLLHDSVYDNTEDRNNIKFNDDKGE